MVKMEKTQWRDDKQKLKYNRRTKEKGLRNKNYYRNDNYR